tara:strand:- start:5413 stop:7821 length:2409 start_codon:yes stop_codon:yes gene_type:complete
MAERYKPKTNFASQIAVQQPFGQAKISQALQVAQQEQKEANEQLFRGLETIGRTAEKFKTKKDIENFTVDFETIEKTDEEGNTYTVERPKPMKNKMFFFEENRDQYDKFVSLKAKQEINRSLKQQASAIKRRVQSEFGNNPEEFIAQMQPVLDTIKESVPQKYYNLMQGDFDDIYTQNLASIENSYFQEQEMLKNKDYEEYWETFSESVFSNLNNNKIDTAKYALQEIEDAGIDWQKTSSSARINHKRNVASIQDTINFYEKYGNFMPGLSIADQTETGQAISLHNLEMLKGLVDGVGDVTLFSRKGNIEKPDVTITLDQFNNSFKLNSASRSKIRTAINRRIAMLNTETSEDSTKTKLLRLAEFVSGADPQKGNTNIEYIGLTTELMSSTDPKKRKGAFAIFKANPIYKITEGDEFDANNVSHYSIPILHQFASGKMKTAMENKIFSKDTKFLNDLLRLTVANQYGKTFNVHHLDLSPTTEKYLQHLNSIYISRPLEDADLANISEFEAIERDQIRNPAKTKQKIDDLEKGIRNAVEDNFEYGMFSLNPFNWFYGNKFQSIDPSIEKYLRNRIINNIHFLDLDKGDVTEDADLIIQNLAQKGIIGISELNTAGKTKGEVAALIDRIKDNELADVVMYPIENFAVINPNTGRRDTKFIEAMIYKKFLESDQNAEEERDTPPPKYKKGFLFVTPVTADGRAPIRDYAKMEYTIKYFNGKDFRELRKNGETLYLRPLQELQEVYKFDTAKSRTRVLINELSEETRYQVETNGQKAFDQILDDLNITNDEAGFLKYFNEYTKDIP